MSFLTPPNYGINTSGTSGGGAPVAATTATAPAAFGTFSYNASPLDVSLLDTSTNAPTVIAMSRLNDEMSHVEEAAQGSFGRVLQGVLDVDQQTYSVKQSKKAIAGEGDLQQRLQEIYALSAASSHPHLMRYHDAWVEERSVFMRAEWLPRAVGAAPLPETELRRLAHDVAAALHHLHSRGIAHRDVKPANILCRRPAPPPPSCPPRACASPSPAAAEGANGAGAAPALATARECSSSNGNSGSASEGCASGALDDSAHSSGGNGGGTGGAGDTFIGSGSSSPAPSPSRPTAAPPRHSTGGAAAAPDTPPSSSSLPLQPHHPHHQPQCSHYTLCDLGLARHVPMTLRVANLYSPAAHPPHSAVNTSVNNVNTSIASSGAEADAYGGGGGAGFDSETGERFLGANEDDGDHVYLSPEALAVCESLEAGFDIDMYALGATCLELMGSDPAAAQRQHQQQRSAALAASGSLTGLGSFCSSAAAPGGSANPPNGFVFATTAASPSSPTGGPSAGPVLCGVPPGRYSRALQELVAAMMDPDPRRRPTAFEVARAMLPPDMRAAAPLRQRQSVIDALAREISELAQQQQF